jgi:hypothetical protein
MIKPIAVPGNAKIVRTRIVELFKAARCAIARNVNRPIRTTYREIGRQIAKFEELVEQPAVDLRQQCSCGFARRNLWKVRAYDRARPEQQSRQTPPADSITGIVSNSIECDSSSVLRTAACSRLPCFPFLRLLSKRNQGARSFYETEGLDSG